MRFNFRIKLRNTTLFFMVSSTQTLEGVMSKLPGQPTMHYVFWDIENCTLTQAKNSLTLVQSLYGLSNIYITSDRERSYHAFCFTPVPFRRYLQILLATEFVDWNFIHWTMVRGQATIRTSRKQDRSASQVVDTLITRYEPIPENLATVIYDTGLVKKGLTMIIQKGRMHLAR